MLRDGTRLGLRLLIIHCLRARAPSPVADRVWRLHECGSAHVSALNDGMGKTRCRGRKWPCRRQRSRLGGDAANPLFRAEVARDNALGREGNSHMNNGARCRALEVQGCSIQSERDDEMQALADVECTTFPDRLFLRFRRPEAADCASFVSLCGNDRVDHLHMRETPGMGLLRPGVRPEVPSLPWAK